MNTDVTKFDDKIYQIDVHMEGKPQRMSCYYIDTSDPILIEVGPSNSFPYLISALESLGIQDIKRTAITHLHLDHVGGIGHLNEKYKENFVYVHELGLKHLPNPERLWKAVSDVYTEEWLKKNWGEIKPISLENIKSLNDGADLKLDSNRNLKALYSPGHAKHHYTFYKKPHQLISEAKESIDNWIMFINNIEHLSDDEASAELVKWLTKNYESLDIDNETIKNYIGNGNFVMQINGIRNYLSKN